VNYLPWKHEMAPKNPHSCFGDYPREYMQVITLILDEKRT